jgi:hypothetical protein
MSVIMQNDTYNLLFYTIDVGHTSSVGMLADHFDPLPRLMICRSQLSHEFSTDMMERPVRGHWLAGLQNGWRCLSTCQ